MPNWTRHTPGTTWTPRPSQCAAGHQRHRLRDGSGRRWPGSSKPFFSTKGEKGTGLGLPRCMALSSRAADTPRPFTAKSGTEPPFKVYLPRVQKRPLSGPSPPGLAVMPGGSETVLLVEDEDGVRALAPSHFAELRLHRSGSPGRCRGTADRGTAPGAARSVGDRRSSLPRMSGREVAERWRQRIRVLKILFLSGYTDDGRGPPRHPGGRRWPSCKALQPGHPGRESAPGARPAGRGRDVPGQRRGPRLRK